MYVGGERYEVGSCNWYRKWNNIRYLFIDEVTGKKVDYSVEEFRKSIKQ